MQCALESGNFSNRQYSKLDKKFAIVVASKKSVRNVRNSTFEITILKIVM